MASTAITFTLSRAERVSVRVYDVRGRRLSRLSDRRFDPGRHTVTWNGNGEDRRPLPAGIYFVCVKAKSFHETLKIVSLK